VSALTLDRVTKTYPGEAPVVALNNVTLRLDAGELVAVVGPSGSGKSTLLHIAGALERPTSGVVSIAGHDTSQLADRQLSALRAKSLGFVFQGFFLLEHVDVVDNVAQGLLYQGVGFAERRRRASETLEAVGLGHRLRHRPTQLSGGERQRVAIARALVGRPAVLIADEPTGNLDSASGADIVALLKTLNHDGTTVVVVTHDKTIANEMKRHVSLLDGHVVEDTGHG
jgi:putative ABC transport system ATP-binding protein